MAALTLRGGALDGQRVEPGKGATFTVAVQEQGGRLLAVDSPFSSAKVGRRAVLGVEVRLVRYTARGEYVGEGSDRRSRAEAVA